MNIKLLLTIIILLALTIAGLKFLTPEASVENPREGAFTQDGLSTDTSKRSIALEEILDGGPGKDGIPALTNPEFVDIAEANTFIDDEIRVIVVEAGSETKLYPYNILVWHEIVNDIVGGKPLAITFCPLCGSAIVFDASNNGERDLFGVSGKLYESNLLMYDQATESLWSQALGRAVVGERVGEELAIYPAQVVTYFIARDKYPDAKVLSINTGYGRNYNVYPYGDYDNNDSLIFPVSIRDSRFPAKEVMYVVRVRDKSVAFPINDIGENVSKLEEIPLTVQKVDSEIVVRDGEGDILSGYYEMWFSWATHHQEDGVVWQK